MLCGLVFWCATSKTVPSVGCPGAAQAAFGVRKEHGDCSADKIDGKQKLRGKMMGEFNFSRKTVVAFPNCDERFWAKRQPKIPKNAQIGLLGVFSVFFMYK